MAMTNDEKKYALKRVEEIRLKKINSIKKDDYTTKAVGLSADKKLKALKEGKFRFNPKYVKFGENPFENRYIDLVNTFIFDGETPEVFDEESYNKELRQIDKDAFNIKDQIMLGSSEEALSMIQLFEDTKTVSCVKQKSLKKGKK